jgi:hypothetical protein
VRRSRDLGFTLDQIRVLLDLADQREHARPSAFVCGRLA